MKEHHAPTRLLLQAWDGHIIWSQSGLVRRSRVIADGRKLTKPYYTTTSGLSAILLSVSRTFCVDCLGCSAC